LTPIFLGFIRQPGARQRMECGESSPLCFLETKSGEDSPHSIRSAISVTAIAVFDTPVYNYASRDWRQSRTSN